jgi:HSP20 family protein
MTEVKEAPKPKTVNGQGQTTDVAPRTKAAPLKTDERPFGFMRQFAEEMDRLFENFGLESWWPMPRVFTRGRELLRRAPEHWPVEWSPKLDVLEREGQFVVRVDLPGLTKEAVTVELGDELLTIRGQRKYETKEERAGYHYAERSFGSFYRAIPLPEGAEAAKATAEFHNGVLEVVMPAARRPEQTARRLEIREVK